MPGFVESKIYSKLVLEEGQEAYEKWVNPPVAPLVKIYIFNLTNKAEFLNGKLLLKILSKKFFKYAHMLYIFKELKNQSLKKLVHLFINNLQT